MDTKTKWLIIAVVVIIVALTLFFVFTNIIPRLGLVEIPPSSSLSYGGGGKGGFG